MVAKEGGFTNASKTLRIQQPAISRMVKQLEDSLGFALFERVGRRVQLTAQGKEVFERSQRIFEEVDSLQSAVGHLSATAQGPLNFGASEPIASHFVPDVLGTLLAEAPQLYPVVYSGSASMLFEKISSGELEFGLFFHIPSLPPTLKMKVLKKIRFHLVIRKDLRKKAAALESFIGSREIDDTTTRAFPTLEKLKKLHPKASIKISSNNLTAHRTMVLKGLGCAVLPDFLIEQDLKSGTLTDLLPAENLQFDLKLVQRQTAVPSLNMQTFLHHCK
ncbi:LysR family regulatory protein [Bdellovibrio bacteriovorus str. Tiberius]|uniref:LysR family regulatory protein n=1 Tax=Bdellovibrio bacteriovorus str. Tiberius TaxID=1069642 RepID=K7YSX9_BDEBC|nr:LysR family regulatory protein [Bdellovibrio bacteriovorus str. Tiberius]